MTNPNEVERPRMTGDEWAALPENARRYIMMLETDCDPSGTIRSEMILRDQVEALEMKVKEVVHALATLPSDQGSAS